MADDREAVWSIVVAAGSGSRFGGEVPKQYHDVAGRRVLDWSLEAAASATDGVVLVVSADRLGDAEPLATTVVAGAATRSGSVRAGLAAVPADVAIVVVHDAARPAARGLFEAVVAAVREGADAALPGVPVVDTIKRVDGVDVVETLDRDTLVAVQTPQAFRAEVLRRAHGEGGDATDDGALVEQTGGRVVVVPGDPANLKVTTAADLDRVAAHLHERPAH